MRVTWDGSDRSYSSGVGNGMLYPKNSPGVAWSGLISVSEKGDDSPSFLYVDGQKIFDHANPSSCAGTIHAFTYPDDLETYLGLQNGITLQVPQTFGLSYKTSNELHLIYNVLIPPSSEEYNTIGEVVSLLSFSWDFTTLPVQTENFRASAHVIVSLDSANADAVSALEALLYGDDANDPELPEIDTVTALFESYCTLIITDNGDGTFTATGPDTVVYETGVDGGTWNTVYGDVSIDGGTWTTQWDTVFADPLIYGGTWNTVYTEPVVDGGTWGSLYTDPAVYGGTWSSLYTGYPVDGGTWTDNNDCVIDSLGVITIDSDESLVYSL